MGMIYGRRSSNTGSANTIIQLYGYEVSIAMDDRSRGGDAPLTRTSLMVTKDGEEVTRQFAGVRNTENGAINDPEGWELLAVMRRIAEKANPQKFYLFSRKDKGENGKTIYVQLGILTASSIEQAADDLGLPERVMVPTSKIEWAILHDGAGQEYHLEEMPAYTGHLPRVAVTEPETAAK